MEFTGERLVPGASDPDLENEHFARYRFAESLCPGRRVLDAGCGLGYGSQRMARAGASVVAVDNDAKSLRYGQSKYPGGDFLQGDCVALPFQDSSFDLVVAFELIEHLSGWADFISEAGRVLAPEGLFLVSTPNRACYRKEGQEPNPFHVHEFEYDEFRAALAESFTHCVVYAENHVPAISFTSGEADSGQVAFETRRDQPAEADFFLAVCSTEPADLPPSLTYVPAVANVLREREEHIQKLHRLLGWETVRHAMVEEKMSQELSRLPYRILRRLRLAPKLPDTWAE